jgi:CRISPR/Cas system Type II protein with McrA/HNH and RuvC-like nuclease domain
MNLKLVDSLVQLVHTLSDEEREIFIQKLNSTKQRHTVLERVKNRQIIPSDPVEILYQVRQERDRQLDDALQNNC